jgi:HEXXH motif-containing protein
VLTAAWRARVQRALRSLCEDSDIAREVRAHSRGLLELCGGVEPAGIPLQGLRGLPVGALELAAETGAVDPAYALASAAAHLHLQGRAGSWSVRLRGPRRLRFGRWLTAVGAEHRVEAAADFIEVQTRCEAGTVSLLLERSPVSWSARARARALPAARLWEQHLPLFATQHLELLQAHERLESLDELTPQVCAEFEGAARFVSLHAPEFVGWIRDVVAGLIPLRGSRTSTRSSTHPHRFGFVAASVGCSPVQLAEALVHESSHEYFAMAERVSELVNGADPLLYYSPLRKCGRPIRSIFLAYHAVVNMLLLYRASLAHGYRDDGYCAHYSQHYRKVAGDMLGDLSRSPGLTPAGRSFLECTRIQLQLPMPEPVALAGGLRHVG